MTVTLHYARPALYADYARAAVGVAICFLPLLFVASNAVTLALAALGALFLLFGARTALRHATQIVADDSGIAARGPFGGRIAWERLERLKLAYYATRRDRKGGWMHMTLAGDGRTLRLDSSLDGFNDVARLAARAGVANNLEISPATRANFAALDIALPAGAETPA
ncbi:hypothetical protein [Vineibacter terrae]|uniref:hypothetical protein n=1 Tax=Vineibacter terrae TaxID=2586908 RepID=UPI002E35FE19|nr:hypothetical protein [Vineibacter terrae]HEX2885794.1 hypothetical protein [Vineibacter terrae]